MPVDYQNFVFLRRTKIINNSSNILRLEKTKYMTKQLYKNHNYFNINFNIPKLNHDFPNAAFEPLMDHSNACIVSLSILSEQASAIITKIINSIKYTTTTSNRYMSINDKSYITNLPLEYRLFQTIIEDDYQVLTIIGQSETLLTTFQIADHKYSYYDTIEELKNNVVFNNPQSEDQLAKLAQTLNKHEIAKRVPFTMDTWSLKNLLDEGTLSDVNLNELPKFILDDLSSYI